MNTLAAIALTLVAQAAPSAQGVGWEHVLVRHETFEDFYADGACRGTSVWLSAERPVKLLAAARTQHYFEPGEIAPDYAGVSYFQSGAINVDGGFDEVLASWNVESSAGSGFCVEIRVAAAGAEWSPWLRCGDWGARIPSGFVCTRGADKLEEGYFIEESYEPARVSFEGGAVDVDVFVAKRRCERAQYRIRAMRDEVLVGGTVVVRRVTLCFSRKVDAHATKAFTVPRKAITRIDVPYRSQRAEAPELSSRICSPTSVAMVLGYRGVELPTAQVAERLFDAEHDIYGNWNRAVQGAFSLGVPGYLARFSDWNEVAALIAAGQPLVISIAVKPGELDGAPYEKTAGHLLVLTGFDEHGDVCVNDPAAIDAANGRATYKRAQLEHVWMARGGTSYVLLPKAR